MGAVTDQPAIAPRSPHPAIAYAESDLGVHVPFHEAQNLINELDEALTGLDKAQDAKRDLEVKIEDREMGILIEERGKHADSSQAAFDRHLKVVLYGDEPLKRLKSERNNQAGICTGFEIDINFLKLRIQVNAARMTELGGYFIYLAATKTAVTAVSTSYHLSEEAPLTEQPLPAAVVAENKVPTQQQYEAVQALPTTGESERYTYEGDQP